MRAYTILSNGWKTELFPRPRMEKGEFVPHPKDFTDEELENIVGGYIRVIPLSDEVVMIVNGEENDQPLNQGATELFRKANPKANDLILGHAVVCRSDMIKGEEL